MVAAIVTIVVGVIRTTSSPRPSPEVYEGDDSDDEKHDGREALAYVIPSAAGLCRSFCSHARLPYLEQKTFATLWSTI